ncbi:hypothetical protein AB0C34_25905 [Nocardia sp. NPDC049220]|uniref:hypothetical protein n=1 Tax=Nocardia sp. NPDC049220 TaxID=3155273 RepID=UPI0033DC4B56
MVNPLDVAKAVVTAVAGPVPVAIFDARTQSNQNNDRDSNLRKDADDYWKSDRQIIDNEWGVLDPRHHQPAPNKILSPEAFETWTHQQIWEALNGHDGVKGVEQADINSGADGWRRLTEQATNAINAFRTGVDQDIATLWAGRAANSAMKATRGYSDEFQKLAVSFQMVANGIDLMQGYLDQAKRSVPPPEQVDGFGEFMGHIPGNGVLKLSKHRADEAAAHAQEVMTTVYRPGVLKVDGRTPLLPEPFNPVDRTGEQPAPAPGPNSNGPNPGGVPSSGKPDSANGEQPGSPNSIDPQNTSPQNTNPQNTDPLNTSPANTTPQNATPDPKLPKNYLDDPLGRPGTPGPGSPGAPGFLGTPSPGKSIPGGRPPSRPGPGAPGSRAGNPQAGRPGMSSMPGMGAPAGRGKGDDNEEHKTPDYLIQDRTTELLGVQPRVLPPGGVIGE